MSTAESVQYKPNRAEAKAILASKEHIIWLDRSDLAALIRTLATLEERRERAARALAHMAEEVAGLRDLLEMARLQID